MDGLDQVRSAFWEAMRPDAVLSVSQWADQYRILDSATSGHPGRWRTSRTPYLREPMDRLSPSDPCQFVILMFASQLGKSEVANNWIGRSIHHSPGPALMVQPTVEMAQRYSRQRLARMVAATPALHARVGDSKSRDGSNTILSKEYPGGILILAGSNSAAGLSSMPVRYLALDEVDRFSPDAGGEGDPVELSIQRTAGFSNRKILLTSTPTFAGLSRIEEWYDRSDRRRNWLPCPGCGDFQVLQWPRLRWDAGRPSTAIYICEHSGCVIENRHKAKMLPDGDWRPDVPAASGLIRGYHLNALYTPHGWPNDFAELARQFMATRKEPVKLKVFVNTKLAETFDPFAAGAISHDYLTARCVALNEEFGVWLDDRGVEHDAGVPDSAVVLTAAVDVQADRLEVEVFGWGVGEEVWSLDYRRIPGDLSAPGVWAELDVYLGREWTTVSGWTMRLERVLIDSGGHYTSQVYDFVREKRTRQIVAIKGRAGPLPIWNPKPSRSAKGRVALYTVGVDAAKELIYARLKLDAPGPGFAHHPRGRAESYFRALVSERQEKVIRTGQPRIRWILPPRTPNEALDLRVYGYAGLKAWIMAGHRLEEKAARRAGGDPTVDRSPASGQASTRRPVPGTDTSAAGWLAGVPGKDWIK